MENKVCLYIATHNITGLKYFGKTTRYFTQESLQKNYTGSGTYWNNHLKQHGVDITMEIYGVFSLNEEDDDYVEPIALAFSEENNIVEDKERWANLRPENGLDGVGPCVTDEFRLKVGEHSKGKAVYVDEFGNNIKISVVEANERGLVAESKGRKYDDETNKKKASVGSDNGMFGKTHSHEAKLKQGEKSKNTVACFDLIEKIMKRINKDEFYEYRFIKYVGATSKYAKEYYENKKN